MFLLIFIAFFFRRGIYLYDSAKDNDVSEVLMAIQH